jgi:hypothetical protein
MPLILPTCRTTSETGCYGLAGKRATTDGDIIITAQTFRTRERNRQDALDRLTALIQKATEKPKKRRRTRPSRQAAKERRLEQKRATQHDQAGTVVYSEGLLTGISVRRPNVSAAASNTRPIAFWDVFCLIRPSLANALI